MPAIAQIHGDCDSRFLRVREVFEEYFGKGRELGAGLAVSLDGRPVIDLWGGHADPERTRKWEKDTLVNVFSVTKAMTAICAHRLVDQGLLDPDRKVCSYWPEFGKRGKEEICVRHILSHRAGLPGISGPLPPEALFDREVMTRAMERQELFWTPGAKHGYHARTYGWLMGEVVRRVIGRSLGAYFRDEIAGPLGLDFHIGLEEVHHGRVARMTSPPPPSPGAKPNLFDILLAQAGSLAALAFLNPPSHLIPDVVNTAKWRRAELPSSNGHGTARSIARLYGALACGGAVDGRVVLSPESIALARTEQSRGPDAVLVVETRFGLGFMLPVPGAAMGPNDRAFGHSGIGGSLGFADPEARVGFGYVTNRGGSAALVDERPAALIAAFYDSL